MPSDDIVTFLRNMQVVGFTGAQNEITFQLKVSIISNANDIHAISTKVAFGAQIHHHAAREIERLRSELVSKTDHLDATLRKLRTVMEEAK